MDEYNDIDATFSALADPTRRAILRQLLNGPARITEIAKPYSISLNSVSKHVRILEKAALIERDVRGREHWIEFRKEPLATAQNWVDTMIEFWDARLTALEELLVTEPDTEFEYEK